jgi:hypothetical protein
MDSEGIKSVSDVFEIRVQPVNDLPVPDNPFPSFQLRENQSKIAYDLDDAKASYFVDVDSTQLYFRAVLDTPEEHSDQLAVEVIPETNDLRLSSIGTYGRNIGVRVYCHDHAEILTMSASELELLDAYQTILVNITSLSRTFPPQWLPISLSPIPEDTAQENILKLRDYVSDEDDILANLTFSIFSLTHSGYVDISIDDETTELSIYPRDNFDGTAKVTLSVTDDEQNRDLTTVPIEIIPSNDRPIVEISEPANGTQVRNIVDIIGSAYDPEGQLSKVEISVGSSGTWSPVNGLSYWTYSINVNDFGPTVKELVVRVRAEDATSTQSLMDRVYLTIQRPKEDSDGDGVADFKDKFVDNPSEWEDSDGDGYGDNSDLFPEDVTQWIDTDDDGYGDNQDGNYKDRFPYDPTQWFDTDNDGHGDNDWGNSGDHFKFDPEKWKSEEAAESGSTTDEGFLSASNISSIMLIVVVMIGILCALVFVNYAIKLKKSKKE